MAKRFFCNTCKRIKRVHRLPANVSPLFDNHDKVIGYTSGDCTYHVSSISNRELRFGPRQRVQVQKKAAPAAAAPTKRRK